MVSEASPIRQIDIAFEGMEKLGLPSLWHRNIEGCRATIFDVGTGGVEMGVVGDDIARPDGGAKENALGRTTLVGRNNVLETRDITYGRLKRVK